MDRQPNPSIHRRLRGIFHLTEAASEADAAASDIWQFAVPIEILRSHTGLTEADIRWLVGRGFAEHRVETTTAGKRARTFRAVGRLNLLPKVCFVASRTTLRLAEKLCELLEQANDPPRNLRPRWDAHSGNLTWGLALVKTLPNSAESQRAVLDSCEQQEWADVIDSPFNDMPAGDRSRYLSRVLNHLNCGQKEACLHFSALDKGRKLRWRSES